MNVNGWIILDAKKLGDRDFEVLYVEQSRGFELRPAEGWLVDGRLCDARRSAEKARKAMAKAATVAATIQVG